MNKISCGILSLDLILSFESLRKPLAASLADPNWQIFQDAKKTGWPVFTTTNPKLLLPLAMSAICCMICLDRNWPGIESVAEQILSIKLTGMPNIKVKDCDATMIKKQSHSGV